jgi:hypothetical protein
MEAVALFSEEQMRALAALAKPTRPRAPYPLAFPKSLWDRATAHLRVSGVQSLEQLVLWAGYPIGNEVTITSLLLPETEAEWGWVRILSAEQPRIVEWLVQRGQLMFAETHTHGGQGSWATAMSEEDRRHPAGRQDGFLAMIVPAYATHGMSLERIGVWECRSLEWRRLSRCEVADRIRITDDEEIRNALARCH